MMGEPDDDSVRMALYGSAFVQVDSTLEDLDKVIYYRRETNEDIWSSLDSVLVDKILKDFEVLFLQPLPEEMNPDVAEHISALRKIVHNEMAIEYLDTEVRNNIRAYGHRVGSGEHAINRQLKGHSSEEYKNAYSRYKRGKI